MRFRMRVGVVLVLAAAVLCFGCAPKQPAPAAPEKAAPDQPIKIGFLQAITGERAATEEYALQGAALAIEEINAQGGINGRPLKLIIEDTAGKAAVAITGLQKMVAEHPDMPVVFGSTLSAISMPMLPYVREARVAYFSGASSPKIHKSPEWTPWYFRTRAHDEVMAKIITAYFVEELGRKKIAILYDTDEYGSAGAEVIRGFLKEKYGIEPLAFQGWSRGDKDFSAQLRAAVGAGADTILSWAHSLEAGLMIKQLHELGLGKKITAIGGGPGYPHPIVMDLAKQYADGVMGVTDRVRTNPLPKTQAYVQKYEARYKRPAEYVGMHAYDMIHLFAEALKKIDTSVVKIDREAFREAVHKVKLEGAMATYEFDKENNSVWAGDVVMIKDGQLQFIKMVQVKP